MQADTYTLGYFQMLWKHFLPRLSPSVQNRRNRFLSVKMTCYVTIVSVASGSAGHCSLEAMCAADNFKQISIRLPRNAVSLILRLMAWTLNWSPRFLSSVGAESEVLSCLAQGVVLLERLCNGVDVDCCLQLASVVLNEQSVSGNEKTSLKMTPGLVDLFCMWWWQLLVYLRSLTVLLDISEEADEAEETVHTVLLS